MPFPKFKLTRVVTGGTSPRLKMVTDPNSGVVTESYVACNVPLPDRKYNTIGNMVQAGVTLKEVNTRVVSDSSPDSINSFVDDVFTPKKSAVKVDDVSNVQPSNDKEK